MFELESSLSKWRGALRSRNTLSSSQIAELEVHLRDSTANLQSTGLSEEEALLVARHRLGQESSLSTEYEKVHPEQVWLRRVLLMIGGYLGIALFLELVALDQAFIKWIGATMGWGNTAIPLPFFGDGYQIPWTGVAHSAVGLLSVFILGWALWSLAHGQWFHNRRFLKPAACIFAFALTSIGVVATKWFLNTLTYRVAHVEQVAQHSATAAIANIGVTLATTVLLLSLLGILWNRSDFARS